MSVKLEKWLQSRNCTPIVSLVPMATIETTIYGSFAVCNNEIIWHFINIGVDIVKFREKNLCHHKKLCHKETNHSLGIDALVILYQVIWWQWSKMVLIQSPNSSCTCIKTCGSYNMKEELRRYNASIFKIRIKFMHGRRTEQNDHLYWY